MSRRRAEEPSAAGADDPTQDVRPAIPAADHDIEFPRAGPGRVKGARGRTSTSTSTSTGTAERLGVLASRPFYRWWMDDGPHTRLLRAGGWPAPTLDGKPADSWENDPEEYWSCSARSSTTSRRRRSTRRRRLDPGEKLRAAGVDGDAGTRGLKWDDEYYAGHWSWPPSSRRTASRCAWTGSSKPALARSTLLRGGHGDKLRELAEVDRGVRAAPVATDVRMVHGQLHVTCTARWTDASAST